MIAWHVISGVEMAVLALVGPSPDSTPAGVELRVDPCVHVDAELVRRLVEVELIGSPAAPQTVVTVDCTFGKQQVRLADASSRTPLVRSIELQKTSEEAGDVRERELALAIAELVRRRAVPDPPLPPKKEERRAKPRPPPQAATDDLGVDSGVVGTFATFAGGEQQLGLDLLLRVYLGRWLCLGLGAGARSMKTQDFGRAQLEASALAATVSGGIDLGTWQGHVGLLLLASVQGQLVKYHAQGPDSAGSGETRLGAVLVGVGPVISVPLGGHLALNLQADAGRAVHGIRVRNQGEPVDGLSGFVLSSALGLVAHF